MTPTDTVQAVILPGFLPDLGGGCILRTSHVRAIGGGLILTGGVLVILLGASLVVRLPSVPNPLGQVQAVRESRRFARAEAQGQANAANAPWSYSGGEKRLGTNEEPF